MERQGAAWHRIVRLGCARHGNARSFMKIIKAKLQSIAPYSQGRYHSTDSLDKEGKDAYEKRTWRDKLHVNEDGNVFIPPMAFKNCISEIAKFLAIQIPGKGKSTYTKHFEAGVLVLDPLVLPIKKDEVPGEWLFVPASGKRGDGKRVMRCFPTIAQWSGEVTFHILDDTITADVFKKHLEEAGKFIGIGRFRPRNNGYYGRFEVKSITVEANI
jgi:hypothetical protein